MLVREAGEAPALRARARRGALVAIALVAGGALALMALMPGVGTPAASRTASIAHASTSSVVLDVRMANGHEITTQEGLGAAIALFREVFEMASPADPALGDEAGRVSFGDLCARSFNWHMRTDECLVSSPLRIWDYEASVLKADPDPAHALWEATCDVHDRHAVIGCTTHSPRAAAVRHGRTRSNHQRGGHPSPSPSPAAGAVAAENPVCADDHEGYSRLTGLEDCSKAITHCDSGFGSKFTRKYCPATCGVCHNASWVAGAQQASASGDVDGASSGRRGPAAAEVFPGVIANVPTVPADSPGRVGPCVDLDETFAALSSQSSCHRAPLRLCQQPEATDPHDVDGVTGQMMRLLCPLTCGLCTASAGDASAGSDSSAAAHHSRHSRHHRTGTESSPESDAEPAAEHLAAAEVGGGAAATWASAAAGAVDDEHSTTGRSRRSRRHRSSAEAAAAAAAEVAEGACEDSTMIDAPTIRGSPWSCEDAARARCDGAFWERELMRAYCRRTCGVCGPLPPWPPAVAPAAPPAPPRSPAPPPAPPIGSCLDDDSEMQRLAEGRTCHDVRSHCAVGTFRSEVVRRVCPATCQVPSCVAALSRHMVNGRRRQLASRGSRTPEQAQEQQAAAAGGPHRLQHHRGRRGRALSQSRQPEGSGSGDAVATVSLGPLKGVLLSAWRSTAAGDAAGEAETGESSAHAGEELRARGLRGILFVNATAPHFRDGGFNRWLQHVRSNAPAAAAARGLSLSVSVETQGAAAVAEAELEVAAAGVQEVRDYYGTVYADDPERAASEANAVLAQIAHEYPAWADKLGLSSALPAPLHQGLVALSSLAGASAGGDAAGGPAPRTTTGGGQSADGSGSGVGASEAAHLLSQLWPNGNARQRR